jgi:hypothetical protein
VAALKGQRRRGSRFALEQALIERWLGPSNAARASDEALGLELARCGRLIKGYGSTNERGKDNLLHIVDHLAVGPTAPGPRGRRARGARGRAGRRRRPRLDQTCWWPRARRAAGARRRPSAGSSAGRRPEPRAPVQAAVRAAAGGSSAWHTITGTVARVIRPGTGLPVSSRTSALPRSVPTTMRSQACSRASEVMPSTTSGTVEQLRAGPHLPLVGQRPRIGQQLAPALGRLRRKVVGRDRHHRRHVDHGHRQLHQAGAPAAASAARPRARHSACRIATCDDGWSVTMTRMRWYMAAPVAGVRPLGVRGLSCSGQAGAPPDLSWPA